MRWYPEYSQHHDTQHANRQQQKHGIESRIAGQRKTEVQNDECFIATATIMHWNAGPVRVDDFPFHVGRVFVIGHFAIVCLQKYELGILVGHESHMTSWITSVLRRRDIVL